jgi:cytochrome o ubiquinol oxidase subunit IV
MSQPSLDNTGAHSGTLAAYTKGFILSIVLTAIPFALVIRGMLPRTETLFAIFGTGIAQILVHLYYFLHLNTSSRARWNLMAMLFALLIMILVIGGTIWIMYHLNYRLM